MKQILAMILAVTLVFGCVPVLAFAEETTENTAATETTAATTAPTEETVTEPTPVTITGISVAAQPTKTVYQIGETLDLTGGSVSVSYSDGTSQTVAMTAEMVSGFNNTAAFTQTLTVAYEGFEAYFDVTVSPLSQPDDGISTILPTQDSYAIALLSDEEPPRLIGLDGDLGSSRTVYYQNDSIDLQNAVLIAEYSDGTTKQIAVTEDMVEGFDTSSVGSYTATIRYEYMGWGGYHYKVVTEDMLSGSCGDNATWNLSYDGVLTVSGKGSMSSAPWSEYISMINTVVIEEGITAICDDAFNCCTKLTDVSFPESLVIIEPYAFHNCTSLIEVTFPQYISSVRNYAFANCSNLIRITFEGLRQPYAFMAFDGVTAVGYYPNTEDWQNNEFFNSCSGSIDWIATDVAESDPISYIALTTEPARKQYVVNQDELDVSDGIITVFYTDGTSEEVKLTPEMIPNFSNANVGSFGFTVFYKGHITYINLVVVESEDKPLLIRLPWKSYPTKTIYFLGEGLDLTGGYFLAEYSDGSTKEIPITEDMVSGFDSSTVGLCQVNTHYEGWYGSFTVTIVDPNELSGDCGSDVYWELSRDGTLRITGNGNISYCAWTNYDELIKDLVIEEGITSFPDNMFSEMENLTSVSLPGTLEEIPGYSFHNCSQLHTITFSEGVTTIGWAAFSGCTNLTTINFPKSLTDINWEAFYGCTSLTEITLPKKLKYLGSDSFANCTGLQTITFEGYESPSGGRAFEGVSATGYYPGTSYWNKWFFENCGGDIEWIATGAVVGGIRFDNEYLECYISEEGTGWTLSVTGIPSYLGIDCEFSTDSDIITIGETSNDYCTFSTLKAGTAVITATDKRSGNTASATVVVKEPEEIFSGYKGIIQSDTYSVWREYTFTPSETGEYVLSGASNNTKEKCSIHFNVSYMQDGEWYYVDLSAVNFGETYRSAYSLESGRKYRIFVECYAQIADMEGTVDVTISLNKSSEITGIEIIGGDREVYGVVGETFWHYGLSAKLFPESTVGDIVWESSNPELISVFQDAYSYGIQVHGEGSVVLTAKCGEFSDSITVTTKKPQKIFLNTPIQQALVPDEAYMYAFTPEETGRYVFELETMLDTGYLENWFEGKYPPEDMEYSNSDSSRMIYGTFTGGVTYYFYMSGYGIRAEDGISIITVKKQELKPRAMDVVCLHSTDTQITFGVNFVPSNSYDNIVSWESSNTDILDTRYSSSGTTQSFSVYGRGEVTITAVSESGLRASCTVTVGQCYNGHTYGPWKQTKAKTCTIDGQETATCICGLRKYQPIPATGHNYDSNCDTECNDCGATRAAEHDFTGNWLYSETVHWHNCVNCGERSQIQNHIPGAAATQEAPQTCTECGYVIKSALSHSHSYGTELTVDETGHWYACSGCNARKNYNAHSYTSVCDADCNDCGYTRKNVHVSGGTWVSDKAGHWQSCTKCNTKLNYAAHVPGAPATANTAQICSICRYEIQKAIGTTTTNTVTQTIYQTVNTNSNHTHKYSDMLTLDEVGHWYACSGCTSKKEYAKHKFVNDCDADCDTCGYTRAVSHATEANWSADGTGHWYSCKDCGEKVGFASHQAENANCMICRHPATGSQIPSATTTMAEPNAVAATESGNSTVMDTTTTEVATKSESDGMPWWMMIVAGVVSSAGTLGIVAIVIWINRKKIVAMFMGK